MAPKVKSDFGPNFVAAVVVVVVVVVVADVVAAVVVVLPLSWRLKRKSEKPI